MVSLRKSLQVAGIILSLVIFLAGVFSYIASAPPDILVTKINDKESGRVDGVSLKVRNKNVYAVWEQHLSPYKLEQIYFSKSVDGGESFKPSKVISSDLVNSWNRFPYMDITKNETVYVIWEELTLTGPLQNRTTAVWFSRSFDGGITWKNKRLTNYSDKAVPINLLATENGYVFVHLMSIKYHIILYSSDFGNTFKIYQNFSKDLTHSISPNICVATDFETVYIAYIGWKVRRDNKSKVIGIDYVYGNLLNVDYDGNVKSKTEFYNKTTNVDYGERVEKIFITSNGDVYVYRRGERGPVNHQMFLSVLKSNKSEFAPPVLVEYVPSVKDYRDVFYVVDINENSLYIKRSVDGINFEQIWERCGVGSIVWWHSSPITTDVENMYIGYACFYAGNKSDGYLMKIKNYVLLGGGKEIQIFSAVLVVGGIVVFSSVMLHWICKRYRNSVRQTRSKINRRGTYRERK